jgi:hypothetical protein
MEDVQMKRLMAFVKHHSLLCVATLTFLILPALAFAQATDEGLQYQMSNDGNITITGYSGTNAKVEIPSEIDGHAVTAIGNGAFSNNKTIIDITIPEGVISIGNGACSECHLLENVALPSTIKIIGEGAFKNSYMLKSIEIPEGVTSIEDYTFYNCMELQEAILPKSLKSIGYGSFCGNSLKSIDLPQGLESIGVEAFVGSQKLENLTIPNSVKDMKYWVFYGCPLLKSVVLPAGLSKLSYGLFYDCPNLEKVVIPKSVKSINSSSMFDGSYKVNVWGFSGSAAEKLAKKLNLPFVAIDPVKEVLLQYGDEKINGGKLAIDLASDNKTLQLTAQTSPESPWPDVTWKSSNAKVASVDTNGLVTGLKKGMATITATAIDGSGKKVSCEINVK